MAVTEVLLSTGSSVLGEAMKKSKKENKLLVLEFMALWSEPCKYMKKVLNGTGSGTGLADELRDDADFYALDIAVFKQFARRMQVEALPTFVLLKGYKVMGRVVGVEKEELKNSIKEHKGKSPDPGAQQVKPEEDIDNPVTFFVQWLKTFF